MSSWRRRFQQAPQVAARAYVEIASHGEGHILADVAQHERELISQRTKAALAAAKRRGVQLGGHRDGALPEKARIQGVKQSAKVRAEKADMFARDYAPRIAELREQGHVTLAALASALNADGDRTPRGGLWSPTQVARLLSRIDRLAN